jgi:hypothetical protein
MIFTAYTTTPYNLGDVMTGAGGAVGIVVQTSSPTGNVNSTGTARAGSANTIQLRVDVIAMNGGCVRITGGTGAGQMRREVAWNDSTKTATVSPDWTTNPDNTSVYSVETLIVVVVISGTFAAENITNQNSVTTLAKAVSTSTTVATYMPGSSVLLTGIESYDAATNLNEDLDNSEVAIDVGDGTKFQTQQIILIDSEYMYVESIATNTLTVKRAYMGAAATHSTGADIYIVYENIHEKIRDASVAGTWGIHTDPSTPNDKLVLDCNLIIGRADQTAITFAQALNEYASMGSNVNNTILVQGSATYPSKFNEGAAIYTDYDESNYPPLYTHSGSVIKHNYIYANQYSIVGVYATTIESSKSIIPNSTTGYVYTDRVDIKDSSWCFSWTKTYYNLYLNNITILNSGFGYPLKSLPYMSNIFIRTDNDIFALAVFLFGELEFSNMICTTETGAAVDPWIQVWGAAFNLHAINSELSSDGVYVLGLGTLWAFMDNTFEATVLDYDGNPIPDVTVKVLDSTGYHSVFQLIPSITTITYNSSTSLTCSPNNTDISVGDVIRLLDGKYLVTNKPSATGLTVTQNYEGSTNRMAAAQDCWAIYKKGSVTTDSSGFTGEYRVMWNAYMSKDDTYGGAEYHYNYSKNPFRFQFSKAGYETVELVKTIGRAEGYKFSIKMRNSLSLGRDSLNNNFK